MPQKKAAKKNAPVSQKQRAPAATGMKVMSSATQFRTKQVREPKKYPGSICVTGHEYLGAVSTTGATTGSNLMNIQLNPLGFLNTRMSKYGELFDKFLFRKFVLHYTSADPTTATGQYILAYDRDMADTTPPASSVGIRQYFAMAGSQINNVWMNSSFRCPLTDQQDFYYTNDTGVEGRIVNQGQIYLAAVSGTTFHGSVWIEYELELYDPSIETPPTVSLRALDDLFTMGPKLGSDSYPDMFYWLSGSILGVEKDVAYQVTTVQASEEGLYDYKAVCLPPGEYYMDFRLSLKSDSSGEGILDFQPHFSPYNRTFAQNPTVDEFYAQEYLVGFADSVVDVQIIEESGLSIADTNSSAVARYFISITPAAGLTMLIFWAQATSAVATLLYANALLSFAIATAIEEISSLSGKKHKPLGSVLNRPKPRFITSKDESSSKGRIDLKPQTDIVQTALRTPIPQVISPALNVKKSTTLLSYLGK